MHLHLIVVVVVFAFLPEQHFYLDLHHSQKMPHNLWNLTAKKYGYQPNSESVFEPKYIAWLRGDVND